MCGGAIISDFIGVKRDRDLWFELDPSVDLLGLGAVTNTPTSKDLPPLHFPQIFSPKRGTNYYYHFFYVLPIRFFLSWVCLFFNLFMIFLNLILFTSKI